MSDAKAADAAGGEQGDSGPQPSKLPLILGMLNSVVVLGAVGLLAYTRILYHRPQITEEGERDRIAQMKATPAVPAVSGYMVFESQTINISPSPPNVKPIEGSQQQIAGKLHYATIGFSLELRDIARKDELEALKPLIQDQFLALVGRKQFHELTSVQGRYVVKTQLIEIANGLASKRMPPDTKNQADNAPLVTNLFFNQFIVQ